eukprot:TRINITY_DN12180_c0_g1_i1.p1 TRINITY_DN12180_c0_g1~~TRINITY_DN12180_c0_g1_i1.p1  ORF type:complete len:276 (-),score=77.19 TRINITY_DN12180_c0_g1_i1:589-1416(-)
MTAEILTGLRQAISELRNLRLEEPLQADMAMALEQAELEAAFKQIPQMPNPPTDTSDLELWITCANRRLCQLQTQTVASPIAKRRGLSTRAAFLQAEIDVKREALRASKLRVVRQAELDLHAWMRKPEAHVMRYHLRALMRPLLRRSGELKACVIGWRMNVLLDESWCDMMVTKEECEYQEMLSTAVQQHQMALAHIEEQLSSVERAVWVKKNQVVAFALRALMRPLLRTGDHLTRCCVGHWRTATVLTVESQKWLLKMRCLTQKYAECTEYLCV